MSSVAQKDKCFALSSGVCCCFQAAHNQFYVQFTLDTLAFAEGEQGVQAAQCKLLNVLLVIITLETSDFLGA